MRYLKNHKEFNESVQIDLAMGYTFHDILESLSIFQDNLLISIKAESVAFDKEFHYKLKNKNMSLDLLAEDSKFITASKNKALKISKVENTDDYETFVSRSMKFLTIFMQDANELMNPMYIVIQSKDESKNAWGELKLFKVNDDIKKFYDTLSSKTIEMKYKGKNYIYSTSNSGNEWYLGNIKDSNNIFKKYLRKEDLKKLAEENKNIKITII